MANNEPKLVDIQNACVKLGFEKPSTIKLFNTSPHRRKVLRAIWLMSVGVKMDDFNMQTTGCKSVDEGVAEYARG